MDFYSEIISKIASGKITKANLQIAKIKIASKYNLERIPKNSEILAHADEDFIPYVLPVLQRKAVRTVSGVAVVAVMTSPEKCPHGKCIYCPGGPEFGSAQSYTGKEPAARRAVSLEFDPYRQVRHRIEQLNMIGHPTDKIDLIIMGGTLTARLLDYQEQFVKRCFDAMNSFSIDWTGQISGENFGALNLEEAQLINETAKSRCIGLTIETRPDYCKEYHVDNMLRFGATRVELGVQTVYDDILKLVKRGHSVADTVEATRICKDAGLKVCYHMMPGLPGSDMEKDFSAFKEIFENINFRPDMLKIYPTLVMKGTELYEIWKRGEYRPLEEEEAVKLLARIKENIPPWVRVQRIERDIPADLIDAGIIQSNIREQVAEEMAAHGKRCRCIRCREIGYKMLKGIKPDYSNIELQRMDYYASGGKEVFLSFEDKTNDAIIGYLRLRIPSEKAHRPEVGKDAAIIRELKVLGQMVEIGKRIEGAFQHRGYGISLMQEAERIAREEFGKRRMLVNSGIGAKEYYRKFGYERNGFYMEKKP